MEGEWPPNQLRDASALLLINHMKMLTFYRVYTINRDSFCNKIKQTLNLCLNYSMLCSKPF